MWVGRELKIRYIARVAYGVIKRSEANGRGGGVENENERGRSESASVEGIKSVKARNGKEREEGAKKVR